METNSEVSRGILYSFLDRWPLEKVKALTLNSYVNIGDRDTFCQWVEHRTKPLGSIQGVSSIKFGIYKRGNPTTKPKYFNNDDVYSWQKQFGTTRSTAFEKIKKEIIKIIDAAIAGDFEIIDSLNLTNFFKWKVAYLYSNERLIPIFKPEILREVATHFNFINDIKTPISVLQKVIIDNKPSHLTIYEYADYLLKSFGQNRRGVIKTPTKRKTRKATNSYRTRGVQKNVNSSYIADFKHDKLQEALKKKLITLYGSNAVKKEENFVDIKLILPNSITFYEIKTASYASDCIKFALGQVLSYIFHDDDQRKKKIIVVGQFPPNEDEKRFIKYIQSKLTIDFAYEHYRI